MDISEYSDLYFVGLKGSGMCALALLLQKLGHNIIGSDVQDVFYTDEILNDSGITCYQGFDESHINSNIHAVIYSAAYSSKNNQEMRKIKSLGIPNYAYPEALGGISKIMPSCAVIGTHGKTSSTALLGIIAKALELPVMTLTGGKVVDWDNSTFWYGGTQGFFTEVCEYRNHFEHFDADFSMITSAELDHPDYFEDEHAVYKVFYEFLKKMINKSKINLTSSHDMQSNISECFEKKIIAYGDSSSVKECIKELDQYTLYYGYDNTNDVIITSKTEVGVQRFSISGFEREADVLEWTLPVPGEALVLNAVGALLLVREWINVHGMLHSIDWSKARDVLSNFKGISRRSEVLYKDNSYIIIDDYGHHPTAIIMTLQGIKDFYKPKRLIVDFMPHTYSRTLALLDDFARAFFSAEMVVCNDIYASPREESQGFNGKDFAEQVGKYHNNVLYIPDFEEATLKLYDSLQEGDVLVSMGAGDNFRITHSIVDMLKKER